MILFMACLSERGLDYERVLVALLGGFRGLTWPMGCIFSVSVCVSESGPRRSLSLSVQLDEAAAVRQRVCEVRTSKVHFAGSLRAPSSLVMRSSV